MENYKKGKAFVQAMSIIRDWTAFAGGINKLKKKKEKEKSGSSHSGREKEWIFIIIDWYTFRKNYEVWTQKGESCLKLLTFHNTKWINVR